MSKEYKYLFGPVASRRLGLSLGVDIVPLKTCTQNCVYCQLGVDGEQTLKRDEYVQIEEVVGELAERIDEGLEADYITLSGSGEPTLHSRLGELIDGIKKLCDIPVAVITNGTLLSDPTVRADCCKSDVVLPSLDAGDEETFRRINCPHKEIRFDSLVEGLVKFRSEYGGEIWLEVFMVEGINTDNEQVEKMRTVIERIGPDKIQLNTAVRPVTHGEAVAVGAEKLAGLAAKFGCGAEVIADFSKISKGAEKIAADNKTVLETLKRRPCTLDDLSLSLGMHKTQLLKSLQLLERDGAIEADTVGGRTFYKVKGQG